MIAKDVQRTLIFVLALCVSLGIGAYALFRASAAAHPATSNSSGNAPSDASAVTEPAASSGPDDPKVIRFVKDPETAPVIQARDIEGNPVSTANWKGKVVIVNFWATWCPPCREEIPALIDLQTKYKDKLQIIGISEDEDGPEKVLKFAQQKGMNYPIIMSTQNIIDAWGGVPALPTSYVVDEQGRVMTKHMGLKDMSIYDREVRSLSGMQVDARIETFVDMGQIFMKNAANATELPDVDFTGLTDAQKKAALRRMNEDGCTCGCSLTVSQCRINDSSCPVSKQLAADVVDQVRTGKTPRAAPSPAAPIKKTATL